MREKYMKKCGGNRLWRPKHSYTLHATILYIIMLFCLSAALHIDNVFADDSGDILFLRNRYNEALSSLPKNSADAETQYLLALCHLKLGLMYVEAHEAFVPLCIDYYESLDDLEKFLGENAHPSVYTPYYQGLAYCEKGDYRRAISALNRYLETGSEIPKLFQGYALCALGECYYRNGELEQASATFGRVSGIAEEIPAVEVYLAATYKRLDIHADIVDRICKKHTTSDLQTSDLLLQTRLSLAAIFAENDSGRDTATQLVRQLDLTQPDLEDEVDITQRLEFFHPRLFLDVAGIYLRQAYGLLSSINGAMDIEQDIRYAKALIRAHLGDYHGAKKLLEPLSRMSIIDPILKNCGNILLGTCYYRIGQVDDAENIWRDVPTEEPLLAVELALAYATAKIEQEKAARLIRNALPKVTEITEYSPAFYPPVDAFPQRDIYRRAGNALLALSQYSKMVVTPGFEEKMEERLADIAVRTYRMGHIVSYPYAVDEPPWGNDPALLIKLAYADYRRGFTFWGGTTEAYSVIRQEYYPELYALHVVIQGIYGIRISCGDIHE